MDKYYVMISVQYTLSFPKIFEMMLCQILIHVQVEIHNLETFLASAQNLTDVGTQVEFCMY